MNDKRLKWSRTRLINEIETLQVRLDRVKMVADDRTLLDEYEAAFIYEALFDDGFFCKETGQ